MCIFANEGGPKSKSSRKETPLKIQKYKEIHVSGKNLEKKMFLGMSATTPNVHISLNKVLRNKFYFDQANQQLKANDNLVEGDHIKDYVNDQGIFDCKKYTFDFMECLEDALTKVDINQGFKQK